jgi:hypothetical protein
MRSCSRQLCGPPACSVTLLPQVLRYHDKPHGVHCSLRPLIAPSRAQGDCSEKPPEDLLSSDALPLPQRACVVAFQGRAFDVDQASSSLWLAGLALKLKRPVPQSADPDVFVYAAGKKGRLWMTRMVFMGDAGPMQGVRVEKGARAYVAGAAPLLFIDDPPAITCVCLFSLLVVAAHSAVTPGKRSTAGAAPQSLQATGAHPFATQHMPADSIFYHLIANDKPEQIAAYADGGRLCLERAAFLSCATGSPSFAHAASRGYTLLLNDTRYNGNSKPPGASASHADKGAGVVIAPDVKAVWNFETENNDNSWDATEWVRGEFLTDDDKWLQQNLAGVSVTNPPFWALNNAPQVVNSDGAAGKTPDVSFVDLGGKASQKRSNVVSISVGSFCVLMLVGLLVGAIAFVRRRRISRRHAAALAHAEDHELAVRPASSCLFLPAPRASCIQLCPSDCAAVSVSVRQRHAAVECRFVMPISAH